MKSAALSKWTRLALVMVISVVSGAGWAVGGPPLVTDDPDTPGDGHWEINLATISQRTTRGYSVNALDADINYGWGDHVQLKADLPWTFSGESDEPWKSGAGFANYGVKWRFMDEEDSGVSVSTYPQYAHSLTTSSIKRGIADGGAQFFLPIEVAGKIGEFDLDGEVGRNFVQNNPSQWEAGIVLGHECAAEVACLVELHQTYTGSTADSASSNQTLLNIGLNWKLSDKLSLLAAAGKEFGKQSPAQLKSLIYIGLQINI